MSLLAIVDALRSTRDVDTNLRGLNDFRRALRGDGGPQFLRQYLGHSAQFEEFHAIWDAQLTVQNYHVTVTLLLALADALGAVAAAAGRQPALSPEELRVLQAGGTALADAILSRRMKALYFNLSSDARGKVTAALALLTATASLSQAHARELARVFDFSLSALPAIARPPREKKGESVAEGRRRAWAHWRSGDALKHPTRAGFVALALALLGAADGLLLATLLGVPALAAGLLNHLAADPPEVQLRVLGLLSRRVVGPKAGVPAGAQAHAFGDAALAALATVAAGDEDEDEEEEGGERGAAEGAAAQAAAAAFTVLRSLITDPRHGLCGGEGAGACLLNAATQLGPGQKRTLRLLQRLRPAASAAHADLLAAAAAADGAVATALLLSLPYPLEPAATGRWLAHAAACAALMSTAAAVAVGLAPIAERGAAPPAVEGPEVQGLLRCAVPPALPKAAFSRGLQHASSLVRHATLTLLCRALDTLGAVLRDAGAAERAAAAAGQAALAQQWAALGAALRATARARLPDPQPLLALFAGLEKEGLASANELMLSAALSALRGWQGCLPGALAEARVDVGRLMPPDPLPLRPVHQLQLLELLLAASGGGGDDNGGGEGEGEAHASAVTSAQLLPALRLWVGGVAEVRRAARRWLLARLAASSLFGGNPGEAALWLDLLPSGEEVREACCAFLAEAVAQALRRPHELFELVAELLGSAAGGGSGGRQAFSLLAPCALRAAVRVLPSPKMGAGDKSAIARYVSSVLQHLLQQQPLGPGAAPLAALLPGVLRTEAERQGAAADGAAAGSKAASKRGSGEAAAQLVLPPVGAPLRSLLEFAQGCQRDGVQPAAKKRKTSGKGSAPVHASPEVTIAIEGDSDGSAAGPAGEQAGSSPALCTRIASLMQLPPGNGSGQAEALAAARAALAEDSGRSSSAAVRQCLFWLQHATELQAVLLFQVLAAAVDAAGPDQLGLCLELLSASPLILASLQPATPAAAAGGLAPPAALAAGTVQLLQQALVRAAGTGGGAAAACAPLLEAIASSFQAALSSGAPSAASPRLPAPVYNYLAVMEVLSPGQVASALEPLLAAVNRASSDLAAESWLVHALMTVLRHLLRHGVDEASVLQGSFAVLKRLLSSLNSSRVDATLQLLLSRHAALLLPDSAQAAQLLEPCVLAPTPERGLIADLLLSSRPECRQLFARLLPTALSAVEGAGSDQRRETLALLLPQCVAYLRSDDGQPAGACAVAAAIIPPLLAFLAAKQAGDGSGASAASLAARLLHQHALPCLQLLLQRQSLSQEQRDKLLRKLLSPKGWSVAEAACDAAALLPTTALKAGAAVQLLGHGSAAASKAESLLQYVQAFTATLSALLRVPSPSAAQASLERQLLGLMDGPLGDAVASLPTAQRGTPAFAELATVVCEGLCTAVLLHRMGDVHAVRLIRRFSAALLPDDDDDSAGGGSAGSSSDSDSEMGGEVESEGVAAAAVALLQRLMAHSRFIPLMRASAASPPPLAPAVQALPRPLTSLLALAEVDPGADPSAEPAAGQPAGGVDEAQAASQLKAEVCELLETLLDLQDRYSPARSPTGAPAAAAQEALLPVVMAGYGGSLSRADRAGWSLAQTLNLRCWQRARGSREGGDEEAVLALLEGPLSATCFAWGKAAAVVQQCRGDADRRREALQSRLLALDPARCALTVTHFPEGRCLAGADSGGPAGATADAPAADEGTLGSAPAPAAAAGPKAAQALPHAAAGYDPAFLLPLAVAALRQGLVAPHAFAQLGLLSVCLRSLAAEDGALRGMAYQAVALFAQRLEAAEFREKQQVTVLLAALRTAITAPFQRLPAVHAVFAAEAAVAAVHPGASMYPVINKYLLKRASLDLQEVPLFGQLMLSGSQQHHAERRWLLQLLLAGLRGAGDARLYRQRYCLELAMSLADAPVAERGAADLALRLVCRASYVPRAARQLAELSGMVPWLGAAAARAAAQCLEGGPAGGREAGQAQFGRALRALRRLMQLRTVMRAGGGQAGALEDLILASRRIVGSLMSPAPGARAATAAARLGLWLHALPLLLQVRQERVAWEAGGGAAAAGKAHRQRHLPSLDLAGVEAEVAAAAAALPGDPLAAAAGALAARLSA